MRRQANSQQGFTLIEMLLAIMIMAFMFAMVYGSISGATNSRRAMQAASDNTHQLQRAMNILDQDFGQVIARSASRADSPVQNAVQSGAREDGVLISFSRNGWTITESQNKSDLVRVAYELVIDDKASDKNSYKLYRLVWRDIDAVSELAPVRRLLLAGISSLKFQYMNLNYAWVDEWPLREGQGAQQTWQSAANLPRAIKMTIDLPAFGAIERIWRLGVAHGF